MTDDRMQRYLDDLLSDEERGEFEARLKHDAALRRELERLANTRDELMRLDEARLPAGAVDRIVEAARRAERPSPPASSGRWRDAWRVAAAVAVVAAALGFGAGFATGRARPPEPVANAGPTAAGPADTGPAGTGPGDGVPQAVSPAELARITRDPITTAMLARPADADAPQFLILMHGPPATEDLDPELHEWRTVATLAWADALAATGRLVAAGELTPEAVVGLAARGASPPSDRVDPGAWFAEPWMVPTRFFVFRARDLEEASRLAGVLPDRSLGGTITLGRLADKTSGGP